MEEQSGSWCKGCLHQKSTWLCDGVRPHVPLIGNGDTSIEYRRLTFKKEIIVIQM